MKTVIRSYGMPMMMFLSIIAASCSKEKSTQAPEDQTEIQQRVFIEDSNASNKEERVAEYLEARCQLNAMKAAGIIEYYSITLLASE